MKKIKAYEVIQTGKIIGLMGAIKDYKIDYGSLVECEGVITGLSLNSKHEVKRDRFYGILSHWFNGSEENQFNVTLNEGHLDLSFNFIKETELKYNN